MAVAAAFSCSVESAKLARAWRARISTNQQMCFFAIRAVLAKDPNLVEAHYNLAVLDSRTGRRLEAVSAYRRCLELDPENAQVRALLERLTQNP